MAADFFTKPLHVSVFKTLRDFILNVDHCHQLMTDHRSVLKHQVTEAEEKPAPLPNNIDTNNKG
jgi:hypothetical protein